MLRGLRQNALVLLSLLLAAAGVPSLASGQTQSEDGQKKITGTVVNAITRAPIGRALVTSPDSRFAALTDGDGRFEFTLPKAGADSHASVSGYISSVAGQSRPVFFDGIPSGPSWLMARKPGFLDVPDEGMHVDESSREVTISLMPEAVVKGRVTLSTNDPANGVDILIFSRQVQEGSLRWVQSGSVQANSNGEFRFAELLPGSYKLATQEWMDNDPSAEVPSGQPYGFPPTYYPGAADFGAGGTIQVAGGQTYEANLTLSRQPYYPVRIPVSLPSLGGGINIAVSPQGHRGPGYSLGFNAEKQRIEGLLPDGAYEVEAMSFGQDAQGGSVRFAVSGGPAEGPGMVVGRNGSIVLNVKEEFTSTDSNTSVSWGDGKRTFAVHGPRLYLQVRVDPADDFGPQGSTPLRPPTGSNDDSLVLENLAPGRYWLRLNSSRGYVAAATMGGVDLLHEPLTVARGSTTPIEITMRDDTAEIEGTVTGLQAASTAANSTAWVYCVPLPDSSGQFFQLGTSSDGKFDSQAVAPGTYRVMAFKTSQLNLAYRDAEAMRAYETKGQVVHVSAGEKTNLHLQLSSSNE
jgi:hypothetical protein